ncbi:MAG: SUMF1/EgtB/PvdO family nonheme iron enzyme [Polyangiaceae bacterium]|nr:SUMF1/EgtB/PvdO family nonheme iron enzyme [Polyangiaceae bacterium]
MANFRKALNLPLIAAAIALSGACSSGNNPSGSGTSVRPQGSVLEAAENEGDDAGAPQTKGKVAAAARVEIPSGKFIAGSTPGDPGRDAVLEPATLEVELGAYTIDRYLYPNEPGKPPVTNVTRSKAEELCRVRGARLCTELEWERACKGDPENAYSTGSQWNPSCAKEPESCASTFGVAGMGAALREWTASDVQPIENMQAKAAAVRGARSDAAAVDHRCAHRTAVDGTAAGGDIGFRCCSGPPNAAQIASPAWQQTFRRAEISVGEVTKMLASVPNIKDLATDISFFKEPDDPNIVLARGDAGAPPQNVTLTTSPLLWSPVPGEELLVVAGRAQKDSFIVAFYRLPGDRYRIGSSLWLKGEKGPVVLGFNGYVRRKLSWATCWDCNGESGNITYREDGRVVITQK